MTAPRVSVLLPVYNAAPYLQQSLGSLARQTLIDYEIVAVDDGSADGSGQILDQIAEHDQRLRVVHRSHGGLVQCLNAGIEVCRSPLIARMDADDVAHPRRLERQVAALEIDESIGVVSCLVRCFPDRQIADGFRLYEAWLNGLLSHDDMAAARFVDAPLAHPSAVVRREILETAGGYRSCGWAEDYDLWLRLFESGVRFAKLDELLYFWRDHAGRMTRTAAEYETRAFLRCKAHFLATGPLNGATLPVVWGAGPTGRRLMRYLEQEGVSTQAVIDIDPKKIGRVVGGAPVIAPQALSDLRQTGTVVVVAVASRGARNLIRSRLLDLGLQEGRDFWAAA